jgi:hypothetical protein
MKKIILGMLAVAFIGTASFAQCTKGADVKKACCMKKTEASTTGQTSAVAVADGATTNAAMVVAEGDKKACAGAKKACCMKKAEASAVGASEAATTEVAGDKKACAGGKKACCAKKTTAQVDEAKPAKMD